MNYDCSHVPHINPTLKIFFYLNYNNNLDNYNTHNLTVSIHELIFKDIF